MQGQGTKMPRSFLKRRLRGFDVYIAIWLRVAEATQKNMREWDILMKEAL